MNSSLSHLPEQKQQEITAIAETLLTMVKPEMIILFGSYARGNWVDDSYTENHITYTYQSDFDFLVVTDDERKADIKEKKIRERLRSQLHHELPVQVIVHGIDYLNKELEDGQYFFTDILKEGVLLYDSGKYKLAEPKILSAKHRVNISQGYFDKWFENGSRFLIGFGDFYNREFFAQAAFILHQATESFFTTILLVFTHYKPKTHELQKLYKSIVILDERFKPAFPQNTEEEKRLFMVLHKAYIDSRYKMNYSITNEELEYLGERVKVLRDLTKEVCEEKIEKMKEGI